MHVVSSLRTSHTHTHTHRHTHTPTLAKSARGVWGMGHGFGDKLYFTRDIPEDKRVPKDLLAPVSAKPLATRAKPKGAPQSVPVDRGVHVQEFKVKWTMSKTIYMEPVQQ